MRLLEKEILFLAMLCLLSNASYCQTDDDIEDFLRAGKDSYRRGLLDDAALDFENVLIIDKTNFQARIWLAQVYIDKKDLVNARKLLREASIQAPDHPKVKDLQKLLGISGTPVKPELVDPIIAETIGGIASPTKFRKYGLVIPEEKVVEENLEKRIITFNNDIFNERNEIQNKLDKNKSEKGIKLSDYMADKTSPLKSVFELYHNQGLNPALDKYFELVMQDPYYASIDDKGLVEEGNKLYSSRYSENSNDTEARFYYGALLVINGVYDDAEEVLKPFRSNPGQYAARLRPFFAALNKFQEQERQRIAAIKYEEEQKQLREAKAMEEANKAKNASDTTDVWAKIKSKGAANGKNGDLANEGKKQAISIHADAYSLYKKGKLEEAIARFDQALNLDPDNPEYNYHLGLAWTDKGLAGDITAYDNAIAAYQKVISVSPDSKLANEAKSMISDIQLTKNSLGE